MIEGRLELGLGRGLRPREAVNLDPKADPTKEDTSGRCSPKRWRS